MEKIKWSGYEWLTRERWGEVHPIKPEAWYDPTAIELKYCPLLECEQLILKTHKNPKYFESIDTEVPIGVGLISCTEKLSYGHYEIEAKLPSGPNLWPAFWAWAFESWPPEIDIIEGYSNNKGSYFNWNIDAIKGNFWKVQTNIHLGKTPENYSIGAKNHWLGWKSPDKIFNRYSMLWKKEEISIFFNDNLVRKITDKKIMDEISKNKMNVIINNMVRPGVNKETPPDSEFIVNYFKYKPLDP
tara:strand:+ start:140 stop:868 length:729 start_codon:yes stop_codon:yes gene_type:complete